MRITKFHIAAKRKFNRGSKEHQSDWTKVNHMKEICDEAIDLYWYADGYKSYGKAPMWFRWVVGTKIKIFARFIYWWAQRLKR